MSNIKHKVFVSYHHENDQYYKEKFENLFTESNNIFIPKSVQMGDINVNLPTETIRQKIRDEYLKDSTVTVVLIGKETWQRKHIDWEIGSSIRETKHNSRSGLLGIILPTHLDYQSEYFNRNLIPPRLYYNFKCGFAQIYKWDDNPLNVQKWIEEAFNNRKKIDPDNSYPTYKYNKSGKQWYE